MAQANANEYWSENVKEHFHTPPGTFTQDAEEITNILLKVSDGNATLALRRLLFYMNRAGSRLGNAEQLEKAKKRGDKTENALPAQMDFLHVHTAISSFPMLPFIII